MSELIQQLSNAVESWKPQNDPSILINTLNDIISKTNDWLTSTKGISKEISPNFEREKHILISIFKIIQQSSHEKWFSSSQFNSDIFTLVLNEVTDKEILTELVITFIDFSLVSSKCNLKAFIVLFLQIHANTEPHISNFIIAMLKEINKFTKSVQNGNTFNKKLREWWITMCTEVTPFIIKFMNKNNQLLLIKCLSKECITLLIQFFLERIDNDIQFKLFLQDNPMLDFFSISLISFFDGLPADKFLPLIDHLIRMFPYELNDVEGNKINDKIPTEQFKFSSALNIGTPVFSQRIEEYFHEMNSIFMNTKKPNFFLDWVNYFVNAIYSSISCGDKMRTETTMLIFRAFWREILKKEDSSTIMPTIMAQIQLRFFNNYQHIGIILFLTLLFDMEKESCQAFGLLSSFIESVLYLGKETELVLIHFIIQATVSLFPIIFSMQIEDLYKYIESQKGRRNSDVFSEKLQIIFTDPVVFAENYVFPFLVKNDAEISSIEDKQKFLFYFLQIHEKWDCNSAISFITNLINCIPKCMKTKCTLILIGSFLHLMKSIPATIPINRCAICSYLLPTNLLFKPNNDFISIEAVNMITEIIKASSSIEAFSDDSTFLTTTLYNIEINLMHLMASDNQSTIEALNASYVILQKFFAKAVQLIPFAVTAISLKIQNKENHVQFSVISIINLLLSSLSVLLESQSIEIDEIIKENIRSWETAENSEVLCEFKKIICNEPSEITKDIFDLALTSICDLFSAKNAVFNHVPFQLVHIGIFYDNETILLKASKLLLIIIDNLIERIDIKVIRNFKSITQFINRLYSVGTTFIYQMGYILKDLDLDSDVISAISSVMCDMICYNPPLIVLYFRQMEPILRMSGKNEEISTIIDCLDIILAEKTAGRKKIPCDFNGATFTFYQNKMIQSFKSIDENLRLTTRNSNGLYSTDIKPVFQESHQKPLDLFSYKDATNKEPESDTDEDFSYFSKNLDFTICSPEDFSTEYEKIDAEEVSNPKTLETTNKNSLDSQEETETLFNEKCCTSYHALFYSFFYDILNSTMKIREDNQTISRHITSIYSLNIGETAKIGVIYVAKNQTTQEDIICNDWNATSQQFREFLTSIGTFVDLSKHHGYDGKLDMKRYSNGHYHVYSNINRTEIMYHVTTLFPNDEGDKQQLKKKRHVGNDNVHIIWCECYNDYDPLTLRSQFNDAHIIIYPISESFYRVSIHMKDDRLSCGPLIQSGIVGAKSLGYIVRWCAFLLDMSIRAIKTTSEKFFRENIEAAIKVLDKE